MEVGIVGLGLIGSYVAVRLSAAGVKVRAHGRRDLMPEELLARRAYDLEGRSYAPQAPIRYHREPMDMVGCGVVLIATKSSASEAVAEKFDRALAPRLISLQNGLDNPRRLAGDDDATRLAVHGGVVTFNVRRGGGPGDGYGPDDYVQTTSGPIVVSARRESGLVPHHDPELPHEIVETLRLSGLPIVVSRDFPAVARAKLLLNLNNGVCAATGVSVAESIADRRLRRVFGACIQEGLAAFRAAGERIGRIGPLAPGLIARFITWPDPVVRVLARPMIQIDPLARSSTLVDLEAGRSTEIMELNGYVMQLCASRGLPCPANAAICEVVRRLEADAAASRPLSHVGVQELHDRLFAQ